MRGMALVPGLSIGPGQKICLFMLVPVLVGLLEVSDKLGIWVHTAGASSWRCSDSFAYVGPCAPPVGAACCLYVTAIDLCGLALQSLK